MTRCTIKKEGPWDRGIGLLAFVFYWVLQIVPNAFSAAAPPTVPPPSKKPAPVFEPTPPVTLPAFPKINSAPQQQQAEPAPEPFIPVYVPPPPPPPQPIHLPNLFKKAPVYTHKEKPRPSLFITGRHRGYRSNPFVSHIGLTVPSNAEVSELILLLETMKRETYNDLTAAKEELRNLIQKVETQRQLHQQNDELYKKAVIPKQTFEESRLKLFRSEKRVEEAEARVKEFDIEVEICSWKLAQAKGATVSLLEMATSYAKLWQYRLDKVRSAESQANAELEYQIMVRGMQGALKAQGATSQEDVIRAQKELEEAEAVARLAKELVEQNTKYLQEALESVHKVTPKSM